MTASFLPPERGAGWRVARWHRSLRRATSRAVGCRLLPLLVAPLLMLAGCADAPKRAEPTAGQGASPAVSTASIPSAAAVPATAAPSTAPATATAAPVSATSADAGGAGRSPAVAGPRRQPSAVQIATAPAVTPAGAVRYECVQGPAGAETRQVIVFPENSGRVCSRFPAMGPCQYERASCRARGGRVIRFDGVEITTDVEREYDKQVQRFRLNAG